MERLEIFPGVQEACDALRSAGFLLIMVTNQPDVGRGLVPQVTVEAMNRHLVDALGLTAARACYHAGDETCSCRKPEPGLLVDAARDFDIDLAKSFMVGDRWRDVEAGLRAGCLTVHIDWGHGEPLTRPAHHSAPSLLAATAWILERGFA